MNVMDNSIYWLEHKRKQVEKVEHFNKKIYLHLFEDEPGFIKLLIADNGKGFTIPVDQMIKPFITEKSQGMGLGLHLTDKIMKEHRGRLEFPKYEDYKIPKEFKSGAKILLVFKREEK